MQLPFLLPKGAVCLLPTEQSLPVQLSTHSHVPFLHTPLFEHSFVHFPKDRHKGDQYMKNNHNYSILEIKPVLDIILKKVCFMYFDRLYVAVTMYIAATPECHAEKIILMSYEYKHITRTADLYHGVSHLKSQLPILV